MMILPDMSGLIWASFSQESSCHTVIHYGSKYMVPSQSLTAGTVPRWHPGIGDEPALEPSFLGSSRST